MTLKVEKLDAAGYHGVFRGTNEETGLDAIVGVHNITLGTALGGCRIMGYESHEAHLADALALSKAMTYKNSLAGLDIGGGKASINTHGKPVTDELLASFAEFMNVLNQDKLIYVTTGDVGSHPEVLAEISKNTDHIWGIVGNGDSGWSTAYGVYNGMLGALRHSNATIKNKRVAVNGVGKVGARTAAFCAGAGARLVVADINRELAEKVGAELGARVVDYTEIHKESCDIYSPCALGGAVSSSTVDDLNCDIICGGANNQLATPDMMDRLTEKGITYVPDYLANAGGVILIGARGTDRGELEWHSPEMVGKLDYISDLTQEAIRLAESQYAGNTARVADMMAERRLVTY